MNHPGGDRSPRTKKSNWRIIALLGGCGVLLILLLVAMVQSFGAARWQIETVDGASNPGLGGSLALDAQGQPHILYFDSLAGTVNYAYRSGREWHLLEVDQVGRTAYDLSLALDEAGLPHVSYYKGQLQSSGELRYAYYDGTAWQHEVLDSEGYTGRHSDLVLDAAGRPHIVYSLYLCQPDQGCRCEEVRYVHQDESGWHGETIDRELGSSGGYPSIAIDSAGRPHISYHAGSDLVYARSEGSGPAQGWRIETVDRDLPYSGSAGGSSLVLGAADRPHIIYRVHHNTGYSLGYAHWDGVVWHLETVDSSEVTFPTSQGLARILYSFSALALDSAGRPQIAYYQFRSNRYQDIWSNTWRELLSQPRPFSGNIRYARYDGRRWHIEQLRQTENSESYVSMALDAQDRPHLLFQARGGGGLQYAHRRPWWQHWAWPAAVLVGLGLLVLALLSRPGRSRQAASS